jgi:hypothetical protein
MIEAENRLFFLFWLIQINVLISKACAKCADTDTNRNYYLHSQILHPNFDLKLGDYGNIAACGSYATFTPR